MLVLLAAVATSPVAHAADERVVLTLSDGRTVTGTLLAETTYTWVLVDDAGQATAWPKESVVSVSPVAAAPPAPPPPEGPLALPAEEPLGGEEAALPPPDDRPLAIPGDAPYPETTPIRITPPPAPSAARPRGPTPVWGFGSGVALGARVAPLAGGGYSPLSWEELTLASAGAPGALAADVGTLELRLYTRRPHRSVDLQFDLIDLVLLPLSSVGDRAPRSAVSVSLAAMDHVRAGQGVARFAFGRGAGLRVDGFLGEQIWIAPYALGRLGVDISPRSRAIELGIYARIEAGFAIGAPLALQTVAGGLLEVTLVVQRTRP